MKKIVQTIPLNYSEQIEASGYIVRESLRVRPSPRTSSVRDTGGYIACARTVSAGGRSDGGQGDCDGTFRSDWELPSPPVRPPPNVLSPLRYLM